jgi:hypothetical protein
LKLSGKKVLRSLLGGHQRYAICGAGKCATDLLAYLLANDLPMPSVVLDDDPKNNMLLGVPVMAPRPDMRGQFDVVLLGTNTFQHDMRRRARETFGTDTPVIDVLRDNFNTAEPAITEDTILNKNTDILFQMNRRDPQPNEKVKIDFLLHSAAHLSSCESILKACIADPNAQTKILVGQINEFHGQTRLESLGCELQRLEDCNLDSDAPHALIILRPYPSDFPAWMRVACHFKEHGIRCVYVSYGIEYDDSRESGFLKTIHFRMSLHRHAWRIYTCSPVVRRDYGRYCSAGNAHVRYLGHPKLDIIHDSSRYPLPAELKDKMLTAAREIEIASRIMTKGVVGTVESINNDEIEVKLGKGVLALDINWNVLAHKDQMVKMKIEDPSQVTRGDLVVIRDENLCISRSGANLSCDIILCNE